MTASKITYSFDQARAKVKANPRYCWSSLPQILAPHHPPKFKLDKDGAVFAMGSCFADEVQHALRALNVNVSSFIPLSADINPEWFSINGTVYEVANFLHRYNPGSMLLEINNLLENKLSDSELLIEGGPQRTYDIHYSPLSSNLSRSSAIERRNFIRDQLSSIRKSQVVILTLGLTEGWFDRKLNKHVNRHSSLIIKTDPERYEFRNMMFSEVFETLDRIVVLIRTHAPSIKIIFTVSPIPLQATSMPYDVTAATTHSKAILLTAVREMAIKHDFVDYFPSYEMATLSDRTVVWRGDGRHVRGEFVQHIMHTFATNYYG